MKQTFLVALGAIAAISLVVVGFTYDEASKEELRLSADLQYRTRLLADSLIESVEPSFINNSTTTLERLIDRFTDRERVVGLAVFDNKAALVVGSEGLQDEVTRELDVVQTALDSDTPTGEFLTIATSSLYVLAQPLHQGQTIVGAFVAIQDASYINAQTIVIWRTNILRLLVQIIVFAAAVIALLWFVIFRPLRRMTETVKTARAGRAVSLPHPSSPGTFFAPLASEISKMTTSLVHARSAASEEARLRLEKLDTPWTAERLKEFTKAYLKDRPIFVVSNREPYIHTKTKNVIRYSVPPSGVITALSATLEACGGVWLAHGSGNADKETADSEGKLEVPPDDPKYTLKRIWLTAKEIAGYYVGFANEALWPLSIMAHTRPVFNKEHWLDYRRVNGKFAHALLNEIKEISQPIILVQDYHFALLPQMIKNSRPDAQVGFFWHIPWPSAEAFSVCPWRKELLEGMLGADVVGFNTQQFCNNFIDTVGREMESQIDYERFTITREGHQSSIKAFPISVAFSNMAPEGEREVTPSAIFGELGIKTEFVGLGVDRLDYAKGILERFKGIEFFLADNPTYHGRFTFLQIAAPSRESIPRYREHAAAVIAEAERVNKLFGTKTWQPIVFEHRTYSHEELQPLYKSADFCLITSLHDGMNLVAKEFVAARSDNGGVLILSQFAGAARDMGSALIINPYSAEETANAITKALTMPGAEQKKRMKRLRGSVRDYNIYRWAAEFIKAVASQG